MQRTKIVTVLFFHFYTPAKVGCAKNWQKTFSTAILRPCSPHPHFVLRLKKPGELPPPATRTARNPDTTERQKPFKISIISHLIQDPDSRRTLSSRAKYSYFTSSAVIGLALMFLAFGSFPAKAEASILGKVLSFFTVEAYGGEGETEEPTETRTSQTLPLLEAAINIDPNPEKGGDLSLVNDSALLPDVGPEGTIADVHARDHQGMMTTYTVRKGDTLAGIAKMFEVSVDTIVWANELDRTAGLRAGQTLVILPINGLLYTVKKGDSLGSIAKKFKGSVDEIMAYNDLGGDAILSVGDTLIIPGGERSATPTIKITPRTTTKTNFASYPSYTGYYAFPIAGGTRTQGVHGHNGVDYGAPRGTAIFSSAEGVVKVANYRAGNPWFGGYGNYIMIEHPNGTQTLYAHLSAVNVTVGDTVSKGQTIGKSGNTGRSTGPHLHFEVRGAKNPF